MAEVKTSTENRTVVENVYLTDNVTHNENGVCYLYNAFVLRYDYGVEIENERDRIQELYTNHPERDNSVQPPIVAIHLNFEAEHPRYKLIQYRVLNRGCLCHMCDANGPNLFAMNRLPNVCHAQESYDIPVKSRRNYDG